MALTSERLPGFCLWCGNEIPRKDALGRRRRSCDFKRIKYCGERCRVQARQARREQLLATVRYCERCAKPIPKITKSGTLMWAYRYEQRRYCSQRCQTLELWDNGRVYHDGKRIRRGAG